MKSGLVVLLGMALVASCAGAEAPCSYIVQGGDSLFAIAQRFGLSTDAVLKVNPQVDPKTVIIRAGDIITLPCAGDATSGESPLDLLARRSDLSILFQAALAAGDEFVKTLNDTKLTATIFAPNDTYFEGLLEELNKTAAQLLQDKPLLRDILAYHVVPGEALSIDDMENKANLTTLLDGEYLIVNRPKEVVRLVTTSEQKIRVDDKQLEAGEAVVYTVRGVLVPATAPIGDAVAGQDECLRTVKEGDTMSDIAKEAGTTVDELLKLNNLTDPNFLRLGTQLVLFESCI